MMVLQILKFVDSPKAKKSKCLESETLSFLQIKKSINFTFRAININQKKFFSKGNL